ncbi:MAG TPA: ACT domain-containing protein, partial [Clostridia bacterium]|nr:ACT domain-containing protein [Clostridia bacterium]
SGAYNAVFVRGNAVGDLMFYGRGAGDLPTGSSLIADLLAACRDKDNPINIYYKMDKLPELTETEDNWRTVYYIRLSLEEKPGVLSAIAGIFGRHEISLSSVIQKEYDMEESTATVVFITHPAYERSIKSAIDEIACSEYCNSIDNVIRVEN